jgi:hypothetical protein
MPELEAVDEVDVLILVDNVTDNLSSAPAWRRRLALWAAAVRAPGFWPVIVCAVPRTVSLVS